MTKTLSFDAIQAEIKICSGILEKLNNESEEAKNQVKELTERVDVLNALDSRLPTGPAKNLNFANLNTTVDERNKVVDEFSRVQRNIEYYTQIRDSLIKLRDEN